MMEFFLAATGILLGIAVFYFLFVWPTKWLKVERIRHDLGIGIKILQISDLHVEKLRIAPSELAELIAHERPDYLFITGDFTEREKHFKKLEPYLDRLGSSAIPVFAVLGNHDYRLFKPVRLVRLLQQYSVRVLRNEAVQLPGFQLIGIDDYDSGKHRVDLAFRNTNASTPKIVITHTPEIVLSIRHPFDYLMAGHLHGKQFNVPFLFYIKNKGRLARKGIYKGKHQNRYGTFYISKGIGQAGINLRFGVRSEVTVHEL